MKQKITSIEFHDPTTSNDGLYTVRKVVRQQADRPGEVVDPTPEFIEVYKGDDRRLAIQARDKAQQDFMSQ